VVEVLGVAKYRASEKIDLAYVDAVDFHYRLVIAFLPDSVGKSFGEAR